MRLQGVHGVEVRRRRIGGAEPVRRVVGLDHLDVGPRGEAVDERTVARVHEDLVRHPERSVRDALPIEHGLERALRLLGGLLERSVHVPAARVLVLHRIRLAQIRLLRELDDEGGLPPGRRVAQNAVLNLACVEPSHGLARMAVVARQNGCSPDDQPGEHERDRKLQSSWHSVPSLGIWVPGRLGLLRLVYKVLGARRSARRAARRGCYWAETAVPANWQRATPAIEYSSPRNETLTVPEPVGVR